MIDLSRERQIVIEVHRRLSALLSKDSLTFDDRRAALEQVRRLDGLKDCLKIAQEDANEKSGCS